MQTSANARGPVDAVVAAGCVAVAMLLTSLASFAFEDIQGWPFVSMVAMCVGLLSVSVGMTCATAQQGGYSSALGLCGGDLLLLWLKWLVACLKTASSFAIRFVPTHPKKDAISFATLNLSNG